MTAHNIKHFHISIVWSWAAFLVFYDWVISMKTCFILLFNIVIPPLIIMPFSVDVTFLNNRSVFSHRSSLVAQHDGKVGHLKGMYVYVCVCVFVLILVLEQYLKGRSGIRDHLIGWEQLVGGVKALGYLTV